MILRPPVWVAELAARFWAGVPEPPPPFPRDLTVPLAWVPHLRVAAVPHLTLAKAAAHLARCGCPAPDAGPDPASVTVATSFCSSIGPATFPTDSHRY